MNDSTALVVSGTKKKAQLNFCNSPLLLTFGKGVFYVPEEAIASVPKGTNRVESAAVLNQIIGTKSPPSWHNFLDPDRLILIRGTEGTSVYTTFKVMDQGSHEEEVFVRHVPPSVCEKQFPKWKEQIAKEVEEGTRKPAENDRQMKRLEVLNWRAKDCSRAQINPENNSWDVCKDPPKSLKTTSSVGVGGKRVGQGRVRVGVAAGAVDQEGISVSSSVIGGDIVKTYKIEAGTYHLDPKIIGGNLVFTTITSQASEAQPLGANDDDAVQYDMAE